MISFAGFVARMGEERVPHRVAFGELVGGKGCSGGRRGGEKRGGRRGGRGWGEGVMPERLKSGSGHHHHANCGPSNDRRKLA